MIAELGLAQKLPCDIHLIYRHTRGTSGYEFAKLQLLYPEIPLKKKIGNIERIGVDCTPLVLLPSTWARLFSVLGAADVIFATNGTISTWLMAARSFAPYFSFQFLLLDPVVSSRQRLRQ